MARGASLRGRPHYLWDIGRVFYPDSVCLIVSLATPAHTTRKRNPPNLDSTENTAEYGVWRGNNFP
jgi:hypothetical protein